MTLLLRSLDIPSRIAVGFYTDPSTQVFGFYPVKSNMAHAWVEVWLGPYGWMEFDPTSRTIAPGEDLQFSSGIDPELFERLLREILENNPFPFENGEESADIVSKPTPIGAILKFARHFWPFLILALWISALAVSKAIRRIQFSFSNDRKKAFFIWRSFIEALADAGKRRISGESSFDFAVRSGNSLGIDLENIAFSFEKSSFSPSWTPGDVHTFERAVASAIKALKRKSPAWRRALGAIGLRRILGAIL
jgi:hypothetical protein